VNNTTSRRSLLAAAELVVSFHGGLWVDHILIPVAGLVVVER